MKSFGIIHWEIYNIGVIKIKTISENNKESYPKYLLRDINWSFGHQIPSTIQFKDEFKEYQADAVKNNSYHPDKYIFLHPAIRITTFSTEDEILLQSKSQKGFTLLELMFQIDQWYEQYHHLARYHYFFEGLLYESQDNLNIPLYSIIRGS